MRYSCPTRGSGRSSRRGGFSLAARGDAACLRVEEAVEVAEHPLRIIPHDEVVRGVADLEVDAGQFGVLSAQGRFGAGAVGKRLVADPGGEDERGHFDFGY